ncbi:MAG: guanosine monophosphate reductase [Elusimicrobia bacterium GWA2_61_42]|nr:MAG: guanosine monophosphate reductase [Elusimicrobia bacterium GWA2_61_42]OGR77630.1 MAG: guanosine monophosphate reductase [Elusimicrobia bacterium GWC2_61_25]
MLQDNIVLGLTFDDVLLLPARSAVLPGQTGIQTRLTAGITLNIPLLSAAMDTVTGSALAIAMAREGGLGIIHRAMPASRQAQEVAAVKKAGAKKYPGACVDKAGRLRAGAAIGAGDAAVERAGELVAAGADVIALDTAHGHSESVLKTLKAVKKKFKVEVIAGNVATYEGALDLIKAGADAIKVGIGPGSICTTRIISGVGVPQLTAIKECCRAAAGKNIPVIADGGIKFSGDITKAIAAGAGCVMLGTLLAGTSEAPGSVIVWQGRKYKAYRGMGSVGAMEAGSKDRYGQQGVEKQKLVPEGIEGRVPYKGPLAGILHQLTGGLRAGLGYCGCRDLEELRQKARFIRISNAGLRESHVHDVKISKETSNYSGRGGE